MDFLKKIFSSPPAVENFYTFNVKCSRCGETINGRIHVYNEPGMDTDDSGKLVFKCRKVVIGDGFCFQPVEVVVTFNPDRRVISREITGGEFSS
jgi:hypothetical protein